MNSDNMGVDDRLLVPDPADNPVHDDAFDALALQWRFLRRGIVHPPVPAVPEEWFSRVEEEK